MTVSYFSCDAMGAKSNPPPQPPSAACSLHALLLLLLLLLLLDVSILTHATHGLLS